MFKLVISDDEGKTTVVPLVRDEITIGRQEGNTIRLTERNVSRRHARLSKANGAFAVEDLESYNGVKINGRKIDASTALNAGDQITIGDYLLALQVDAVDGVSSSRRQSAPTHSAKTAMIQAPEEPRPPARLVMLSPPAPGAEFALSKPTLRIGRAEDLDAWVNHRSISREHAEITRDGREFNIRDLGSANGVRVNGRDVQRAVLQPGDVLELGQVRFRFVGEGEQYVFDSDRTIQVDAVEPGPTVSKAPIVAALSIIILAVVVAAVFAIGAPAPPPDEPGPGPTLADGRVAPVDEFSSALEGCRQALDSRDAEEAIRLADEALGYNSSSTEAQTCRTRALRLQDDLESFERGVEATEALDPEAAIEHFETISDESPLRDAQEIVEAHRLLLEQRLREGREALANGNFDAARRAAGQVLSSDFAEATYRRRATAILNRLPGADSTDPEPDPAVDPSPTVPPTVRPTPTVVATMDPPAMAARSPMDACREEHGFTDNYSRCIIQNVTGSSQGEMAALIEAQRAVGNQPSALRLMQRFVQRFPQHPRASQYSQILNAQR